MIRCIVFDFDGVLVDSNRVKRQAFYDIFSAGQADALALPPDLVTGVLQAAGDGDRYQIIGSLLGAARDSGRLPAGADIDRLVGDYAGRYNQICELFVTTCATIPGAVGALQQLSARYPLYLSSATPEEPLRRAVELRGWAAYFRAVRGRPASKIEHLTAIFARERLAPGELLFVGDGRRDLEAARHFGCGFVGVRNEFNDFDRTGLHMIDNLIGLEQLVAAWDDEKGG